VSIFERFAERIYERFLKQTPLSFAIYHCQAYARRSFTPDSGKTRLATHKQNKLQLGHGHQTRLLLSASLFKRDSFESPAPFNRRQRASCEAAKPRSPEAAKPRSRQKRVVIRSRQPQKARQATFSRSVARATSIVTGKAGMPQSGLGAKRIEPTT
jgi:hypothetical protein